MRGVHTQAREMGADLPDTWVAEIYAEIYARLRAGVEAIPGVVAVLDRLDGAGVPTAWPPMDRRRRWGLPLAKPASRPG